MARQRALIQLGSRRNSLRRKTTDSSAWPRPLRPQTSRHSISPNSRPPRRHLIKTKKLKKSYQTPRRARASDAHDRLPILASWMSISQSPLPEKPPHLRAAFPFFFISLSFFESPCLHVAAHPASGLATAFRFRCTAHRGSRERNVMHGLKNSSPANAILADVYSVGYLIFVP